MAHAQKLDFVFRRNGRVHLNREGRQFSRLLAAEVCASAVVMLDTPCSVVVWRVLATHSIRQFPLHFPSRTSTCAITFQLVSYPRSKQALIPHLCANIHVFAIFILYVEMYLFYVVSLFIWQFTEQCIKHCQNVLEGCVYGCIGLILTVVESGTAELLDDWNYNIHGKK